MELIYNRDELKDAVVFLLDRRYGENRTAQVRAFIKGVTTERSWFCGKRRCLRVLVDIAGQPGAALRVLDLLDKIDAKRKALISSDREDYKAVFRARDAKAYTTGRYHMRETAAVMSEEVRRAQIGEPPFTKETRNEFLHRRREYWNRRVKEYCDKSAEECRAKGRTFSIGHARMEAAEMLLQEELNKLERARQGVHQLSDSAKRMLDKKNKQPAWKRVNSLLEIRNH